MAIVTTCRVHVKIETVTIDTAADGAGNPPQFRTMFEKVVDFASGVAANQIDQIYVDDGSAAATPATYDLKGGAALTGPIRGAGAASFVDVALMWFENQATTTGKLLDVGAGSNPFLSFVKATGDAIRIPAGGWCIWYAGQVDDQQPVAGTGDVLTIDPGANTVGFQFGVVGRSS